MLAKFQSACRCAAVFAIAGVVAGCNVFGSSDKKEPPAPLVQFDETVKLRRVLSANLGGGAKRLRLALAPAGDGSRVYAASADGVVIAYDGETHKRVWRVDLKAELSAGPGVGDGKVVVTDRNGAVIALDALTGTELWRRDIAAEVLAPPAIGAERIFLRTVDGRMLALSGSAGSVDWFIEQPVPVLSQRGLGAPVIVEETVVAGFDNGRIVAANVLTGEVAWEIPLGLPSGRSDIERMVDTDGRLAASGSDLYASGFNSRTAAIAAESGQALWAREYSSSTGVGLDWANLYLSDENSRLLALTRRSGGIEWTNDDFVRRLLSAPTAWGDLVAVGDFEGYVHFVNARSGAHAARVRVGDEPIVMAPYVMGDTLYVLSESGALAGFQLREPQER